MKFCQIIILAVIAAGLTGCQQMQQQAMQKKQAEAAQRMKASMNECRDGELTRKNALERRDCIDTARRQYFYETNYPFMWIIEQEIAADRESAEEYSEEKISKAKYETAIRKHWADTIQADAQALAEARQEQMQRNMQVLQALQGMQSAMPKPVLAPQPYVMPMPTYSPPSVVNTNCYGAGNSINCTSYR